MNLSSKITSSLFNESYLIWNLKGNLNNYFQFQQVLQKFILINTLYLHLLLTYTVHI